MLRTTRPDSRQQVRSNLVVQQGGCRKCLHWAVLHSQRVLPRLTWMRPTAGKSLCPWHRRCLPLDGLWACQRATLTHVPQEIWRAKARGWGESARLVRRPGGEHVICKPNVYQRNQCSNEADASICMFLHLPHSPSGPSKNV